MEIAANNLAKQYPNGVVALNHIDLFQQAGEVHGLLGPNGAGKSTFLRLCATLEQPTSGTLQINTWDVQSRSERRHIRRHLGYLPQTFRLYEELTPVEFLAYVCTLKEVTTPAAKEIARVLEAVHLTDEAHRRIGTFSGGMKQRVGIAQALLGDPRVLILDEPTAGLDPQERSRLRNLLASLADSCLVLLSTHIVDDINQLCAKVAVIYQGDLCFHDAPEALAARAHGHLWELETNETLTLLGGEATILGSVPTLHGTRYRVEAATRPHDEARLVEDPSLEDGYLFLCAQAQAQADARHQSP